MKVIKISQVNYINSRSLEFKSSTNSEAKGVSVKKGGALPSCEECQCIRPIAKDRSDSPIFQLPLDWLYELSRSRFYRPNIFCGDTLYDSYHNVYNTLDCIETLKEAGIKTIIDVEGIDENGYKELVQNAGLNYYCYPLKTWTSSDESRKRQEKNELIYFIKEMQKDNIYISSGSIGWIDMAAFINYWFNPKFDMRVNLSSDGFMHADFMKSYAKKIYRCMTEEDKKSIGWTTEFENEFKKKVGL